MASLVRYQQCDINSVTSTVRAMVLLTRFVGVVAVTCRENLIFVKSECGSATRDLRCILVRCILFSLCWPVCCLFVA